MIHTWRSLTAKADSVGRIEVAADVCVIGSGAGGSAAACRLAQKGKRVVLLEAGSYFLPRDFDQREESMFSRLFYDSGGRRTADFGIRVLHGHGVGGSTLHNINLCKRAPDSIVESWAIPGLSPRELAPYYAEVEDRLHVAEIEPSRMNRANQLFKAGVEKLGYRGGPLKHNREGCVGSGFCELGCAFDAKMNAARVLIPELVKAGGEVFANTRAIDLERDGRRITRARARLVAPEQISRFLGPEVIVQARSFVLACGAVETPALIRRSGLPDRSGLVGSRLFLHPGVAVAGLFDEMVESWKGIPQSYECTEFMDQRIWLVGGSAHPAGAAAFLPGIGEAHAQAMSLYPKILPLSIMLHDESSGSVQPRAELGVRVDYDLSKPDRAQMALGIRQAAKILLAAGAREIWIPYKEGTGTVRTNDEIDRLELKLAPRDFDLVAVHPMGSVWMGVDPRRSCADPTGRLHGLDNAWIADTSLFPTSIGVPPQLSAYAFGLRSAAMVEAGG